MNGDSIHIPIMVGGSRGQYAHVGQWVVVHARGCVESMSDVEFQRQYQAWPQVEAISGDISRLIPPV
jgi:hypothetical protein